MKLKQQEFGFIAISSVLVITAIVTVIGISVSLLSLNYLQTSLSHKKSQETHYFLESCVEDILLTYNKTNTIPTTVTLPEVTCSVIIDSQIGQNVIFTVSATFENYTKRVRVSANRITNVTTLSWQEVE